MNDIQLWMMKQLFVPSYVGNGSTKSIEITSTQWLALWGLEKEKLAIFTSVREVENEETTYLIRLTQAGVDYMANYIKLPPLTVGTKIQFRGSIYSYAFKEVKRNGSVVVWARNNHRILCELDARDCLFSIR